ncbi:MAG: DUF1653 domain-containing protein [Patescibacteria group bacterium]|nr:DUF1653 domain-containing protein [Patescibacteria group bacterium]
MAHKNPQILEDELKQAKRLIKVGGFYTHYKNPLNTYKVIELAIQEASDKICVIYQAEYNKNLIFVRDLDSWLENPEVNGQKVIRFKLVEK